MNVSYPTSSRWNARWAASRAEAWSPSPLFSTALAWSASDRSRPRAWVAASRVVISISPTVAAASPRQAARSRAQYPTGGLTDRLANQSVLLDEVGRRGQVAGLDVCPSEEVECELQLDQGTGVTRDLDLTGGERVPCVVVPQFAGDNPTGPISDQPENPADVGAVPRSRSRINCNACASVGTAAAWPSVSRIASASSRTSAAPGSEDAWGAVRAAVAISRRMPGCSDSPVQSADAERLHVRLTCQPGVERFQPSGRVE